MVLWKNKQSGKDRTTSSRMTKVERFLNEVRLVIEEITAERIPVDQVDQYREERRQCDVFRCTTEVDGERHHFEISMTLEAIEDGQIEIIEREAQRQAKELEREVATEIKANHMATGDLYEHNGLLCDKRGGYVRCTGCDEKISQFDPYKVDLLASERQAKLKKYLVGLLMEHECEVNI